MKLACTRIPERPIRPADVCRVLRAGGSVSAITFVLRKDDDLPVCEHVQELLERGNKACEQRHSRCPEADDDAVWRQLPIKTEPDRGSHSVVRLWEEAKP